MIAVEYHADLKEMQRDAQLFSAIGEDAARAPFDRLAWWQALTEECGMEPLLAVARQGGACVILPLRRNGRAIEPLANWYTFRFQPVFGGSLNFRHDQDLLLLSALARDLAKHTPCLMLRSIPNEFRQAHRLAFAFRSAGWAVFMEQCDVNHVLPVNGRSYAEYLASRPGALRSTLKRKAARVDIRLFNTFDADAWNDYEKIYAQSWKPAEGSPAFLRRFAREEGAAGRLRFGLALADGQPVAAQLWTVEGSTAWIHKLAHTETSRPLSAGTTLSAALFEQVIDRDRVQLVDFGTGDDAYKRDWMEQVRPRYRLDMFRPADPRTWAHLARKGLRSLAALMKQG